MSAGDSTKVATAAPSSDSTVLMMQLNCWKGPGASVPSCPEVLRKTILTQDRQGLFSHGARTMSSLPVRPGDSTKVATVAPSSDSTVLMMQLNCWKGPGASVPGCPDASAPLKLGQKMNLRAHSPGEDQAKTSGHCDWSLRVLGFTGPRRQRARLPRRQRAVEAGPEDEPAGARSQCECGCPVTVLSHNHGDSPFFCAFCGKTSSSATLTRGLPGWPAHKSCLGSSP